MGGRAGVTGSGPQTRPWRYRGENVSRPACRSFGCTCHREVPGLGARGAESETAKAVYTVPPQQGRGRRLCAKGAGGRGWRRKGPGAAGGGAPGAEGRNPGRGGGRRLGPGG